MMALHATLNHLSVEDGEFQSAESEDCQPRFLSPRNLMTFSPIEPHRLNGFRSIPPSSSFHDLKILDHSRIVKTALDQSLQTNIEVTNLQKDLTFDLCIHKNNHQKYCRRVQEQFSG
jgi:hypothetical protein